MNKVTVRTHHVSITAAIKTYAEEKLGKLDKYFDNIQEVVVELDYAEISDENTRNSASAVIRSAGKVIKAQHKAKDMYACIDGVVEKILVQLKKHKEKVREPKRVKAEVAATTNASEKAEPKKKTKKAAGKDPVYIKKPMTPEDAATILEEKQVPFVVFKNADTKVISVIYPIDEDQLGLIETE